MNFAVGSKSAMKKTPPLRFPGKMRNFAPFKNVECGSTHRILRVIDSLRAYRRDYLLSKRGFVTIRRNPNEFLYICFWKQQELWWECDEISFHFFNEISVRFSKERTLRKELAFSTVCYSLKRSNKFLWRKCNIFLKERFDLKIRNNVRTISSIFKMIFQSYMNKTKLRDFVLNYSNWMKFFEVPLWYIEWTKLIFYIIIFIMNWSSKLIQIIRIMTF